MIELLIFLTVTNIEKHNCLRKILHKTQKLHDKQIRMVIIDLST